MSPVQLAYWRSGMLVGNLGDALNPWLMDRLGVEYTHYRPAAPDTTQVVFGIGSILDDHWIAPLIRSPRRRGIVWGSGTRGDALTAGRDRLDVLAVRGPITARQMGLGPTVPQGDPGLLVARYWPGAAPSRVAGRIVWTRHYDTNSVAPAALRTLGCTEQLSMRVWNPRRDWSVSVGAPLKRVSPFRLKVEARRLVSGRSRALTSTWPGTLEAAILSIASAEFVLADSLHGAIIAQSFGVPWAAHANAAGRVPARWADVFGSFGLEPEFVHDATAGASWYRRVASHLGEVRFDGLEQSVADLRNAISGASG